jgi:hypothetical protein
MPNATSCPGSRWCEGGGCASWCRGHSRQLRHGGGTGLLLRVETGEGVSGCPECGVLGRARPPARAVPGRPVGRPSRAAAVKDTARPETNKLYRTVCPVVERDRSPHRHRRHHRQGRSKQHRNQTHQTHPRGYRNAGNYKSVTLMTSAARTAA